MYDATTKIYCLRSGVTTILTTPKMDKDAVPENGDGLDTAIVKYVRGPSRLSLGNSDELLLLRAHLDTTALATVYLK